MLKEKKRDFRRIVENYKLSQGDHNTLLKKVHLSRYDPTLKGNNSK